MGKKFRFLILAVIFTLSILLLSSLGLAARGSDEQALIEGFHNNWNQDPIEIGNRYLDLLQIAYETENLSLFASLYNDPLIIFDIPTDTNILMTNSTLRDEIGPMFAAFTGIKCTFGERRISYEGDMIMIRTARSFTANEFPLIAKCEMLMVLRKSFTHRQPWNYIATDQGLLYEEYLPLSEANNTLESTLTAPATKAQKQKKNHLFW